MKILFHTNAPWVGTGYGTQAALWAPRFRDLGHEIIISAFYGLGGQPSVWNGFQVLPGGQDPYGNDIIKAHAERVNADMVLTLMDVWVLDPNNLRGLKLAHWIPIDSDPLSAADERALTASGAQTIAMSRHGERMLNDAGFRPMYAPHAIDTSVFKPAEDRDEVRKQFGVEGKFVIGINAANKDAVRKSYPEQIYAFARFHERHPDTMMLIHAATSAPQALDLPAVTRKLGVGDSVRFTDQYAYLTGLVAQGHLANWYSSLDLLSNCSYGEGFGLPIIEAQACGTPVVVTEHSAMPELCGAGWRVKGEPFWNSVHQAWWSKPYIGRIDAAYEKAYQERGTRRLKSVKARKFALQYDADKILQDHWSPILKELEDM